MAIEIEAALVDRPGGLAGQHGLVDALVALANDGDESALNAVIRSLIEIENDLRTEHYAALVCIDALGRLLDRTKRDRRIGSGIVRMAGTFLTRRPAFQAWMNDL